MRSTSAVVIILSGLLQTSCVFVGGYSSEGGWYVWPGSFVSLVVVAVVLYLLMRRRR